ncbi:MAG: sodium:proton antiporter [Anaerolineales bacterium]|nr:sodium:proton antiporter [Anaerolineales bacterium]
MTPVSHAPIPLFICIPFVVWLLLIAVMPLVRRHWWEDNRHKAILAVIVSVPVLVYLIGALPDELAHVLEDYTSFIILLGALYIIAGGILVTGDLRATPARNTGLLLLGAVIANFIGTTGASMLLIRPLLKTISERKHIAHIPVFFIFVVSNIGGCLTPLADPPLFLGYLRGVPFTWTFQLLPMWLVTLALVLSVFFIWDTLSYRRETVRDLARDEREVVPLRVRGILNALFLLGVIAAVFFQIPSPYRELTMIAMAILSLKFTAREIRAENKFTFAPINEVAILFIAIFITMAPLLVLLRERGAELGITQPWQFFWFAGGLSSFLDNAPTYLVFSSLAESISHSAAGEIVAGIRADLLRAISCGAVFMGANTYIGNGPNFMVKAIADEQKIATPNFFGYMVYSGVILLPIFALVTILFFV